MTQRHNFGTLPDVAGRQGYAGTRWSALDRFRDALYTPSPRSHQILRYARPVRRPRPRDSELWVEMTEADGWVIAYRIVPREGAPVVAELRVFPAEGRARAGEWSGRGEDVPVGGVPMGLVHRVTVAPVWKLLDRFRRDQGERPFGRDLYRAMQMRPAPETSSRRPGPRPVSDLELLQAVVPYVEGESKATVAKRLGKSVGTVTDYIYRARTERGLLTETKQGKRGGDLTEEALRILRDEGKG